MKPVSISFLFLFILYLFPIKSIIGQEAIDSSRVYYYKIIEPKTEKDLVEGYKFYLNLSDLNLKKRDSINAIQNLRLVSLAMSRAGLLYESENIAVDALELLDAMDHNDSISKEARIALNNHLGITNMKLKNYEKAIDYFTRIIETAEAKKQINTAIKNRAYVYAENGQYNISLDNYLRVYNESLVDNDTLRVARYLDNLGHVQSKLHLPDALKNLEQSLFLRQRKEYRPGLITSYLHLAEFYHDRNQDASALQFINNAQDSAIKSGNKNYEVSVLSKKIDFGFFTDIKRYKYLNDSINNAKLQKEVRFSSLKYESEKYERKTKELQLENERGKTRQRTYLITIGIVLLVSIFLVNTIRLRHKKEKIKEVYRKETELSKKVHDELANDMSDLMNFVENDIEVTQAKKSLLMDNIEDIYLRTRDISTETGSIDLVNFTDSIKHLLMQHNKPETKVITNNVNTIDWQNIEEHKKVVIYRCLQELLVNMKKHSKAKVVSVVFKNHNKKKEIRYVDDGVGFDQENSKRSGLLNVESRIKGIGGSFNFTTSKGNGFKATLEFNS